MISFFVGLFVGVVVVLTLLGTFVAGVMFGMDSDESQFFVHHVEKDYDAFGDEGERI